jgi:hypothetical protein
VSARGTLASRWSRAAGEVLRLAGATLLVLGAGGAGAVRAVESIAADPHYTPAGFFDIHVCHWPDRPLFFMTLFSTERFGEVSTVEVFGPDGAPLGALDPERFMRLERPGKPEKRVFIGQIDVPAGARDGWYTARVRLRDGQAVETRDYVVITALPRPADLVPGSGAVIESTPATLSWAPVPGARHYQVYVRDLWEGERLVHQSPLLSEPRYRLPAGVLLPGGHYAWKVHARDVDEHVLLGDFNHGSQSEWVEVSVPETPAAR